MGKSKNRFIAVIVVLLVAGFVVASLTSFFYARSSLRHQITQSELPLTSDNIYSEIRRDLFNPVFISSMMSTDTFLRDWVLAGEKDESRITRYLKEIQVRNNTITSFFVSERTRKYYHADGLLKTVREDEKRDEWYFRVRTMKDDYEINVDIDMANRDEMTIFINYRVFDYDGNYIGATGVGLTVSTVKMLIEKYQQRYDRNIFFTDREGNLKLHGAHFTVKGDNICEMEGMRLPAREILSRDHASYRYKKDGMTVHVNTRYIPEFDWYLFVEQSEDRVIREIVRALTINLAICLVITILVFMLIYWTVFSHQRDLEKMATTDKLTGINNRRAFDIIIEQSLKEVKRSKVPLSVIIFDIDHFKRINDTFGHVAGDAVLQHIVDVTRGNIRLPDVFFRWGGEEFLIILKECRLDDAFRVAEKIRKAVGSTPTSYQHREIPATISLGVAEYCSGEDVDALLSRTDAALYVAKNKGRDRSEKQPEC